MQINWVKRIYVRNHKTRVIVSVNEQFNPPTYHPLHPHITVQSSQSYSYSYSYSYWYWSLTILKEETFLVPYFTFQRMIIDLRIQMEISEKTGKTFKSSRTIFLQIAEKKKIRQSFSLFLCCFSFTFMLIFSFRCCCCCACFDYIDS